MLDVQRLRQRRHGRLILEDVSFFAADGATTVILGPTDSGKTSLLRTIAGLDRPDAGTILFDDRPLPSACRDGAVLGLYLGVRQHHSWRSVRSELGVFAMRCGASKAQLHDLLTSFGLLPMADVPARSLPPAMKRRLALAAATLARPRHLLLDEPLHGLGIQDAEWFRVFLAEYASAGHSVLLTAASASLLDGLADHVVVLGGGRVLDAGTLNGVIELAGEGTPV